jgi:hypothetical protein
MDGYRGGMNIKFNNKTRGREVEENIHGKYE